MAGIGMRDAFFHLPQEAVALMQATSGRKDRSLRPIYCLFSCSAMFAVVEFLRRIFLFQAAGAKQPRCLDRS